MIREIPHPRTDQIDLASVLKTLGDPIRLHIVRVLLADGELNCNALQAELELPISTCSYHLKLLREAGVTRTRPAGTERFMSVRRDDLEERFPGLLSAIAAGAPAAA